MKRRRAFDFETLAVLMKRYFLPLTFTSPRQLKQPAGESEGGSDR